jgi:transposase
MASLRKQKVGKYTYWQIVGSKRVNGKPQPFLIMHLGTADHLLQRLQQGPLQRRLRSASHGAVALFWQIVKDLRFDQLFEQVFAQKRDGLPAGKSLLLAAIHRAVAPGSKRAFADWARQTTLPELVGFEAAKLTSQHFWDQMDAVTEEQLVRVEHELTQTLMSQGLLSPKLLFYDMTNFFTYIDSTNTRSQLAQRGRNKQKRGDLRQFGLAQVVTREFLLPVLWEVYEGNQTDGRRFIPFLTRIRQELADLDLDFEELTLVFDKGSNSKDNFAALDHSRLAYVASLTPAYHEDLLSVAASAYEPVQVNGRECLCYRTKKLVWGKERTVVVYQSEQLRQGQMYGLEQALAKKYKQLEEMKQRLQSDRTRLKQQSVQRQVSEILKGERGQELIKVTILEHEATGRLDLSWELDAEAYLRITETLFGKRIVVTCREEWSTSEIVAAYWGQNCVEQVFKQFKNPYHNAVRPQYHWTDHKVKVHTFICIIALLLSQVLWKRASDLGFKTSINQLLDQLSAVRRVEIYTVTDMRGRPQKEVQFEEMEPELQKLYEALTGQSI